MKGYGKHNAREVLAKLEALIATLENPFGPRYVLVHDVKDELSIFDWWTNRLGLTKLRDMRKFLREAIRLGYEGYVCFYVGVSGCSNGMWAYKEQTTNGYSPDGACLYKSFTPEYNYWRVIDEDGTRHPGKEEYDTITTIRALENLFRELN